MKVSVAMIGQTVSHYRIIKKLGEGGMGVVYEAEDTSLGRRVAIKFLSESSDDHHFRARFLREARAVSALSHPHIATIYEYGETSDQHPFIVMELVGGQTLSTLLHENGLTLARSVEIIAQVAEALSEAHAHGIIHRDIKPSNVLINDRGQVKVLDFGLAKQINEGHSQADPDANTLLATHTRSDVVVGTPLYLSPEQATSAPVDARSDLFALGALLYECITGRPAFPGTSVIEIVAQVIHVDPPYSSSINNRIPRELNRITLKALAKKPSERYQSAEEFLDDLRRVRLPSNNGSHITKRLTDVSRGKTTEHTSALVALSDTLRRPRLSIFTVLLGAIVVLLLGWTIIRLTRPRLHTPLPEAQRWYETGTSALRDGAYFQASKALERAIAIDDNFPLAHARLAEAWMELDYADKAKNELLRVPSLVPDRSILPREDALYLDAINSTVSNDFSRAIAIYREIEQTSPEKAQVYVDVGRAYEKNNEGEKALENYVKATNLDQQYATAYLRVGIIYGQKRDIASATVAFDKAANLYQALGNVEGQAEVFYQRGYLFVTLGRMEEAQAQFKQALDLAAANNNDPQKVATLLGLSFLFITQGDTAKGQEYANQAIGYAEQHGLDNLIARGLNELGRSFYVTGDYDEAERHYKQSLDFARRNHSRVREAIELVNLGALLVQRLRTDEALDYLNQAVTFFRQAGYRTPLGTCLTYIGRANRRKGDYDAAFEAFRQKLELAQQSNDQPQIASAYGEMGSVLSEQERYPEALTRYDESLTINRALGSRLNITYNLLNKGRLLGKLGHYDEARNALKEAQDLANQPESSYKTALAFVSLRQAEIYLSERRFKDAITLSEQALSQSFDSKKNEFLYKDVALQAKYMMGLAQALSGATAEGKKLCEEAFEMARSTADSALISSAMLALAEAALESGDAQAASARALEVLQRVGRAGQLESAWRAWLIAARASRRTGDERAAQEQLTHATEVLSQLEQKWGPEAFSTYMTRTDVKLLKQFNAPNSPLVTKTTLTR